MSGFQRTVLGPVQVDVQERPAINAKLQVGSVSETITISTQGPQLETDTSDLGQVQDSRTIETLPLNGRNYAQLALLSAGIGPSEPGSRVSGSYGFSSNGARSLQNNFQLDGVDNNSDLGDVLNGSSYVIQPSVDALAEFKVQTNAYSAEFGRGNGAIMNATIKSGTNEFHGDAYEFFRNDVLDARNAFDQQGRQPYPTESIRGHHWRTDIEESLVLFWRLRGFAHPPGAPATFARSHSSPNLWRFFFLSDELACDNRGRKW